MAKKSAQQPTDEPMEDTLLELEQQIGELTAALQRERADVTNVRRRHDEQLAALRTTAKASVIRDLLPVIDNFERALKHVPAELADNDYIKGIQAIVKQFETTLQSLGVQKIKTVGEPFNPHLHEAVSMEEGDGEQEVVSDELQPGYVMGDEVLRHAMVRVRMA
ncbi:MAG TPA: nucleotide exchange factor GrpE [Patescibacteria group bacterium]|nr:nucleotide exchange factor GrpE [Patescibacteria group bacterium]